MRVESRAARRWLLAALTVLLTLVVTVAIAEVAARVAGYRPRRAIERPEPPMHEADAVLGWKPRPGHYELGPYVAGGAAIPVTINPDRSRRSRATPQPPSPELLLVGCSFTMGWAVADEQTWAWHLQELRPDLQVVNRGVGGYGTLQSLLLLEQLIGGDGERPARVLYGFIDHSWRNVAAPPWLQALSLNPNTVATPYATLTAGGSLERHPPTAYPSLPLHQYLAAVALIENAIMQRQAAGRQASGTAVTERLIREMAELCRKAGVPFSLVLLSTPPALRRSYAAYAREHGIDVIDCDQQPRVDEMVPGEMAHPNGEVHRRWAECIAAALK